MRFTPRILIALILTLSLAVGNASGQTASQDQDPIVKKLDEILKRLETIESRIAKLEGSSVNRWRADERGILLDGDGKPIGFWGIDSVIHRPVSR